LTEEGDDVVAEGSVRAQKRDSDALNLRFCGVFVMQAGKIKRLTSYLMEIK
jgi:ketosteroid isomerase-like protein